jgi:hypothetical protein
MECLVADTAYILGRGHSGHAYTTSSVVILHNTLTHTAVTGAQQKHVRTPRELRQKKTMMIIIIIIIIISHFHDN